MGTITIEGLLVSSIKIEGAWCETDCPGAAQRHGWAYGGCWAVFSSLVFVSGVSGLSLTRALAEENVWCP